MTRLAPGTTAPAGARPAGAADRRPGPVASARRLRVVRYTGLAGSILIAVATWLGGALVRLPVHANPVNIWRGPYGPAIILAWLAGTGLLVWSWWRARYDVPPARWVLRTAALWALPLLFAPPSASRDVYAYACQGAVYAAGRNPYHQGVADLPCPWLGSVSLIWRHTPAPYGPLFVMLAGAVVSLAGTLLASIVLFRLLAVVGIVLTAVSVPVVARRCGVPSGRALWLALAAPIVEVNLVAGQHNDALTIGLMMAGLAVIVARRGRAVPMLAGGVLLGLAAAIKITAGFVVPFAVLAAAMPVGAPDPAAPEPAASPSGPAPARPTGLINRGLLVAAGLVAGGAAAAMLVLTWWSRLGFGWVRGLSHSGDSVQWASPPTALGVTIRYVGKLFNVSVHAVPVTRAVALALLAVVLLAVFWRALRRGEPLYHAALALVAVTVLAPVFYPWYAAMPLILLASTARRPWWFVAVCAVASFQVLPDGTSLSVYTKFPGAPLMVLLSVLAAIWLLRRLRAAPGGVRASLALGHAAPDGRRRDG